MNANHIEAMNAIQSEERSQDREAKYSKYYDFDDETSINTKVKKIVRATEDLTKLLDYRNQPYHPITNPLGKIEEPYTEDDFREDEQRANDLTDAKRE